MTTSLAGLELRPLHIPSSIDAPDAADFREMVRIRNLVYAEISGHDDGSMPADELLPLYQPQPDMKRFAWIVVVGGDVVGRAGLDLPQEEGARTASWLVELRRSVWGHGIGREAFALIKRVAREHGRSILQSWAEHPAADGRVVAAPTGFGTIPLDHPARFFLASGNTLEQIVRVSALDLVGVRPHLKTLLAEAEQAAAGYRVVQWTLPTPDEFVDAFAGMKSRMVTDAPSAGLEFDEEVWDAARLRRYEAGYLDAGRHMLVTAAQHVDTGELAAFNELVIGKDRTAATSQEDTLVVAAHRGHRLGMLVKCAGLLAWQDIAPHSPRVITYNAEENRPMLSINERIGFRPISYEGAWKKVLT
ncbi:MULTISPECIES: GNAT family N-acetyltransferase [Microbacterium]|uniref:GNAT family N-acetyltransferase n=1 Tax=Microbacterium TaxID=33882 RepID=UPI002786A5EC|nr:MULTISPECIES: GNAT family N-acetyltransferase [Microbacterium]MDQ1083987.1 RimJ/RimL family protein N-acetyltransferase [Microbacterium sp. SORGH_AS_0344]MDQ1170733.1 RimJ/RimL family protein N-acetyltransferase [Microbacterium proteolyticum]